LHDLLSDGPVRVADAKKLLTDAGISISTIQRAKNELRIRSVRERDEQGKTIGWMWQLPTDEREADGRKHDDSGATRCSTFDLPGS
jgi:hypothetical protein